MINLKNVSQLVLNNKVIEKIEDINGLVIYEAWKNLIASGVPPLTLSNCGGKDLVNYKIYGNSVQGKLPSEYQQVEYIESTGTQYIELGILLTNSDEINTVFLFTEVDTSFKRLFGARNAYESNAYCLHKIGLTNNFRFDYGNYVYTTNIKAEKDIKYNVSIKNNIFTINNESINLTSSDFDTVALASLFYAHSNSGENYTEIPKIRFYSFEIKNKMCLIPCLDNNGTPCMYDTISKQTFYNQGTGEFKYEVQMFNAAPTPEAPIEIESVGEYDETTGKYKIPVKSNEVITNIYLDEPLRKVGDYADYVDFEKGKVIRNVQEKTFNGSENWQQGSSMSTRFLLYDINDLKKDLSSNSRINIMSNYFEAISWENRNLITTNSIYTYVASSTMAIVITNNDTNTVNNFKEWLSVNNVKTYYPIATPIEEDIELPNIPTFKGTNIIEVETKIKPSNFVVKYK